MPMEVLRAMLSCRKHFMLSSLTCAASWEDIRTMYRNPEARSHGPFHGMHPMFIENSRHRLKGIKSRSAQYISDYPYLGFTCINTHQTSILSSSTGFLVSRLYVWYMYVG
jgi:hypothetical protein